MMKSDHLRQRLVGLGVTCSSGPTSTRDSTAFMHERRRRPVVSPTSCIPDEAAVGTGSAP